MDKLIEHYGVLLNESRICEITEAHGQKIFNNQSKIDDSWPNKPSVECVIVEMDGGMVPIVETNLDSGDKRKGKKLQWKEAKLCLAHAKGSIAPTYGGTIRGDVSAAGLQMYHCASVAGFGTNTKVHAVGDGAEWIANQVDKHFATNGSYLIDFYHVCDYLSAAAKVINSSSAQAKIWLEIQKTRLKKMNLAKFYRNYNHTLKQMMSKTQMHLSSNAIDI